MVQHIQIALEEQEIMSFINGLTAEGINEKVRALKALPQEYAINKNPELFEYLEKCQSY